MQNEVLCRFIFPERPGALLKFLDAFSPRWNITLFHYRGQVGIQLLKFYILNRLECAQLFVKCVFLFIFNMRNDA